MIDWPRTDNPEHSRFDTSLTKARDKLTCEVALMGGLNLVISSNARTNRSGEILSRQSRIEDTGVTAYFDRNGEQVCIPCDRWIRLEDNVNAIAQVIGALWGLEQWGAKQMVDQAFRSFAALSAGNELAWWEVLSVSGTASRQQVEAAYRQQVRRHHPDARGSADAFLRIKDAYDTAVREVVR